MNSIDKLGEAVQQLTVGRVEFGTTRYGPVQNPAVKDGWPFPTQVAKPAEVAVAVTDKVNPSHYKSHPSGVECIQITEHYNFCIGNAIKYLWRNGLKDNESSVDDLKKAIWYIQREIENSEKNRATGSTS